MASPKRRSRGTSDPTALAARLPAELRSLSSHTDAFAYMAALRAWLGPLAAADIAEARRGEDKVSPADVATSAGVSAVQACYRHWLA
ncbi:hypothetical protein [Mycolicibacterium psychrotolerans]|uniref:Uncharacterized protein n=1 Tax=Mycolicibacterium psychrotolerans TaxID=216929 RepID=A0A7I7MCA1_9MYCO|nr:hypothetical protein [Mycolicibacterium psychrotolerans]BBX69417.1 hypothetical protein MPSYJ_28780 [Mycolicibacterium psychrotolerans]